MRNGPPYPLTGNYRKDKRTVSKKLRSSFDTAVWSKGAKETSEKLKARGGSKNLAKAKQYLDLSAKLKVSAFKKDIEATRQINAFINLYGKEKSKFIFDDVKKYKKRT